MTIVDEYRPMTIDPTVIDPTMTIKYPSIDDRSIYLRLISIIDIIDVYILSIDYDSWMAIDD